MLPSPALTCFFPCACCFLFDIAAPSSPFHILTGFRFQKRLNCPSDRSHDADGWDRMRRWCWGQSPGCARAVHWMFANDSCTGLDCRDAPYFRGGGGSGVHQLPLNS